MNKTQPALTHCRLVNGKASRDVLVQHLPRVGEFICLASDGRKLVVKVRKVVTVIDRRLGSCSFDLHARPAALPSAVPGCEALNLAPPFQTKIRWPDGVAVPVACTPARLKAGRSERELKVFCVIHRLNVSRKTHRIEVRLFDARPRKPFDAEEFERLIDPNLAMEG